MEGKWASLWHDLQLMRSPWVENKKCLKPPPGGILFPLLAQAISYQKNTVKPLLKEDHCGTMKVYGEAATHLLCIEISGGKASIAPTMISTNKFRPAANPTQETPRMKILQV